MKLIVGLGNPGLERKNNRHNIGYMFIDYLTAKLGTEVNERKISSIYEETKYKNKDLILLKPLTGMNNSGLCVRNFVDKYQITADNLLVIYDDLFLSVGNFRYRKQGSSGGHNGLKSIIEKLCTEKILRLRVGIGTSLNCTWKEWVLQDFTSLEFQQIRKVIDFLVVSLLEWVENKISFQNLMNKYNKKTNCC